MMRKDNCILIRVLYIFPIEDLIVICYKTLIEHEDNSRDQID